MSVNTDDDEEPVEAGVALDGLARLLAGGRHVRLAVLGAPPTGLVLPALDGFERVACVARPDDARPDGVIVADPRQLPFIEALFDRALVTSPLPEDAGAAELRELWRILAPAGLALLVVRARRRWDVLGAGWHRDALAPVIEDAMFEVLDWRVETLPERHHAVLVGKRDGLRPALVGRVVEAVPAIA